MQEEAYTYVALDLGPFALEVEGIVWVTCENLHISLAYLPSICEAEQARLQADLNDMVRRYFTLRPGERLAELFKVRRFYKAEQRNTQSDLEDIKINICGHKFGRIKREWGDGNWYFKSRMNPIASDLEAMRRTWQGSSASYARREEAVEMITREEARLSEAPWQD